MGFFIVKIVQPGVLDVTCFGLVDDGWRKIGSIHRDRSDDCDPLPVSILASAPYFSGFREHPFGLLKDTNQEAFLIHIICVFWEYVVLRHFRGHLVYFNMRTLSIGINYLLKIELIFIMIICFLPVEIKAWLES